MLLHSLLNVWHRKKERSPLIFKHNKSFRDYELLCRLDKVKGISQTKWPKIFWLVKFYKYKLPWYVLQKVKREDWVLLTSADKCCYLWGSLYYLYDLLYWSLFSIIYLLSWLSDSSSDFWARVAEWVR